ncbi:MAG: phytoene/squalene synthase family protein [Acidobacteria bacterium]|nr:phytoene/squalene synthase family protein [Acidobacteriota bacterium]
MRTELADSYAWCEKVARARAKNFYYSFLLLDRERRDAMCAVYAFMRICDDLSDEPGEKTAAQFRDWRARTVAALGGNYDEHALWPALYDTVERYRIPHEYFHHMIDGVESDIDFRPVETYAELEQYCYRVASVVGLTVVHILGFEGPHALPLAEKCGVAFQLTNILRDVKEDYENGRVYLPAEDRRRFGVADAELGAKAVSSRLRELLAFEGARAEGLYQEAMPLIGMVDPAGRGMLRAIIEIYHRLFLRIQASGYEVLGERISLSTWTKVWILVRTKLSPHRGAMG